MAKFPVYDIKSCEKISEELFGEFTVLVLYTYEDLFLLPEIQEELKSENLQSIVAYIGKERKEARRFFGKKVSNMKLCWGGESFEPWQSKGAAETPSITIVSGSKFVISKNIYSLEKPLITTVLKLAGMRATKPTWSTSSKIQELEQLCKENQKEIQELKRQLAKRDQLIKRIFDRLEEVSAGNSSKSPLQISKSTEGAQESKPKRSESFMSEDNLFGKQWLHNIRNSPPRDVYRHKTPDRFHSRLSTLKPLRRDKLSCVGESLSRRHKEKLM
mgnify:FL=1